MRSKRPQIGAARAGARDRRVIAHGSLHHRAGVNGVGHDILDLAAPEIADVEAEVRQRHTEVAVDLFKILFVLVRRPAGPCALAAPCKAADQAGLLILVRQGHHDLALTDALAMDLMDVAYRLGEVKAAEERMTDTLMIFLLFF